MKDSMVSPQYRALFNPAYCAALLHEACRGAQRESRTDQLGPLSFAACFLVLPTVLHRPIREALPKSISTSFATWVSEHPLLRSQLASMALVTKDLTSKGLLFATSHGALTLEHGHVRSSGSMRAAIFDKNEPSSEMAQCMRSAYFVGRWLALAGTTPTTLALIGMRA